MSNNRLSAIRAVAVLVLVLVLATATYAFAAANTVPNSLAGDGSGTISGFTISNIHYTLNGANPAGDVSTVSFTLSPAVPAGGAVYVKFNVGAAVACTLNVAGDTATCTPPAGATPLAITSLQVIAAQ
jgi:hypothetical protein